MIEISFILLEKVYDNKKKTNIELKWYFKLVYKIYNKVMNILELKKIDES